jgi:hypothetical protein
MAAMGAACAQTMVSESQAARFQVPQTQGVLQCQIVPLRPVLDFSFRFQAGYTVRVPLNQYQGPRHRWILVTRIEPEAGGKPVYFMDRVRLPIATGQELEGTAGGGYLLGVGRYRAFLALLDDQSRVCRSQWNIEANLGSGSHSVKMAIGPGTIQQISLRRVRSGDAESPAPIGRLTVLLHATPIAAGRAKVRAGEAVILLGALSSLLDLAPARSVRLVMFSLDQQKEIYREDNFTSGQLEAARQALFDLQLATVDYRQLQNHTGGMDLLKRLVDRELLAENRSDAVVFLGPHSRSDTKPAFQTAPRNDGAPGFFYVEYFSQRPIAPIPGGPDDLTGVGTSIGSQPRTSQSAHDPGGNGTWVVPDPAQIGVINGPSRFGASRDTIDYLVSQLKGKTFRVSTPVDFAKAIDQIRARQK